MYDLLLKGGTVLDPSSTLDGAMDVAVDELLVSSPPPQAEIASTATTAAAAPRASARRRDTAPTLVTQAAALAAWRSGAIRTTSQARPSFSSVQITAAEGSSWVRFIPWTAEVGKA